MICAEWGRNFRLRARHSASYHYIVRHCRAHFVKDKCIKVNIYNRRLSVIHIITCYHRRGGIGDSLSKTVKKKIRNQEQLEQVKDYIQLFLDMNHWNLLSDADDLTLVMDKIMVYDDKAIKVYWHNKNEVNVRTSPYKPSVGLLNEISSLRISSLIKEIK